MSDWNPKPIVVTEAMAHRFEAIREQWRSMALHPASSFFIDGNPVNDWSAAVAILADGEVHQIQAVVGEHRPELFIPADESFGTLSRE